MNKKGFTLLELMVVVLIIGILASIAYPSYQRHILRAHRVDARNALLEATQRLQQNYSITRNYTALSDGTSITSALKKWGLEQSPSTGTARYKITITNSESGFRLEAQPQGEQKKDECGTLAITNINVKTAGGEEARHPLSINCWRS